jgi:hypothetical protein
MTGNFRLCRVHLSPGGCYKPMGVPVRVAQLSGLQFTMPGHWPWLARASLLECVCYQQRGSLRMPERVVHGDVAALPYHTVYLLVPRVQDKPNSQSIGQTRGQGTSKSHFSV